MPQSARVVGVRELKAHASAVLREVCENGTEFIISMRGRPIARIEPLAGEGALPAVDGMGDSRGALSELPRLDWDDFAVAKRLWQPELSRVE
jgi:prevent-host-death family protein